MNRSLCGSCKRLTILEIFKIDKNYKRTKRNFFYDDICVMRNHIARHSDEDVEVYEI